MTTHMSWEEHEEFLRKLKDEWEPGGWDAMVAKLAALSVDQLRTLTWNVGIRFDDAGNTTVMDGPNLPAKMQLILVLDEVHRADLLEQYNRVIEESAAMAGSLPTMGSKERYSDRRM